MVWYAFDEEQAEQVARVCELAVPGSTRVGVVTYIDSLVADMPEPEAAAFSSALAELAAGLGEEPDASRLQGSLEFTPGFQWLRALTIEGFYGDFTAPGYTGPSGWDEIDFNSPEGRRIRKDWSHLRCYRD